MSTLKQSLYRSPHYHSLVNAMQKRRITFRHLVFGAAGIITLWSLFWLMKGRPTFSLPTEVVMKPTTPEVWRERAEEVKSAFVHAYNGYEKYALPYDELKPLTDWKINSFNGWGVTMYDSLDTMLMMGLDDEFQRSLPIIEKATFDLPPTQYAPFFETVIRYLGGLLSAYALSGEKILLTRADDLGRMLAPVFNTSSKLPYYGVNPATGKTVGPEIGILAEIGSCQLEYTYLAKASGRKEHWDSADGVLRAFANADLKAQDGMMPIGWNLTSGQPHDFKFSVGAQADSTIEYLLKQYLLTAQTDKANLDMYIEMTNYVITNLLFVSPTRGLLYVTDSTGDKKHRYPTHTFEHLSCFLPGLFALGAHTLPLDDIHVPTSTRARHGELAKFSLADVHMWAAQGLATTCWLSYADMATGLGPDVMVFRGDGNVRWMDALDRWKRAGARGPPPGMGEKRPVVYDAEERMKGPRRGHARDYVMRSTGYLLRPETLESLYLLWRVTSDDVWRERGWKIFEAIQLQTRTSSGYASLRHVDADPAPKLDSMPSYFMAETLKYLYLMFVENDPVDLHKMVFNTEAHPFPVFEWTENEKNAFGIR